jgi:predicted amidohydrolase YtcJ
MHDGDSLSGPADLVVTERASGPRTRSTRGPKPWRPRRPDHRRWDGGRADAPDRLNTQVHALDGAMVMPGLIDGHVHLNLGGSQAAFELPLLPTDGIGKILGRVANWAAWLEPGAWVVGGIVGSTVMDTIMDAERLARLDDANSGRPVLLRDDTMHNNG